MAITLTRMFVGRRLAFALLLIIVPVAAGASQSAGVTADFVYDTAPFLSAHASTLVETTDGLVTAWFGGTSEGNPDVGIWLSRHTGAGWSLPTEVANGVQDDGSRHPCWNPVLFQPSTGPLLVFYKVGPSPREWWGLVLTSSDRGRTWSDPILLPDGILGPIRAKPIERRPGTLLAGSSTEHDGWVVHMETFTTDARTEREWRRALASPHAWSGAGPLNDPDEYAAIQPTILEHSSNELQVLCRSRQRVITQAWSHDGGVTWGNESDKIFDNNGIHVGWDPIAQFDLSKEEDLNHCVKQPQIGNCLDAPLPNSGRAVIYDTYRGIEVNGYDPISPWFFLGNDTGLSTE